MKLLPENCACRTLVLDSYVLGLDLDYSTFPVTLHLQEADYNYCYLQLKNVLIDSKAPVGTVDSESRQYFVKATLGQDIKESSDFVTNVGYNNRDFLGGFVHHKIRGGTGIADYASHFHVGEQPLIELPSIPNGRYEFRIRGQHDEPLGNKHLNLSGVTLIFQLYLCKR